MFLWSRILKFFCTLSTQQKKAQYFPKDFSKGSSISEKDMVRQKNQKDIRFFRGH